jgi:transposase
MQKISKKQRVLAAESKPEQVVGLDVGDRYSHYCMLTHTGELMEEGRIQSTAAALDKQFGSGPRMRIALETGGHSPWISRLLESYGHQVIVANARKIPTVTASESKNDRNDAEQLARMAAFDPRLLHPIEHRSLERQQDLNLIHTRSVLVRVRTLLVNSVRGLVKSGGGRLPACSSEAFPERARAAIGVELKTACEPLLEQIAQMNRSIAAMDKQIEGLETKYPEIAVLRTVPGVGPVVAACYVLTLDSPEAMETNRQAGAYLGLRPGSNSRATPTRSSASPRPATSICAVCWCSRPSTSWAASGRTRSCAAGDSSWLPAAENEARSEPWSPWPASWPSSCSACGATASSSNRFRRPLRP